MVQSSLNIALLNMLFLICGSWNISTIPNTRTTCPICNILQELGHLQHPTTIKTDNKCIYPPSYATQNLNPGAHATDGLKNGSEFDICWGKGVNNWATYFSKHFAPSIHQVLCPYYIHHTNIILDAVSNSLSSRLSARVCWSYSTSCIGRHMSDMLMSPKMDFSLSSIVIAIIY